MSMEELAREGFTARRRTRAGQDGVRVDMTLPPGPLGPLGSPGGEMARLTRADWAIRAELTEVVGEIRLLEKQARSSALERADAERLRALRSRESRLHRAMAEGAAALRVLRTASVDAAEGDATR